MNYFLNGKINYSKIHMIIGIMLALYFINIILYVA